MIHCALVFRKRTKRPLIFSRNFARCAVISDMPSPVTTGDFWHANVVNNACKMLTVLVNS